MFPKQNAAPKLDGRKIALVVASIVLFLAVVAGVYRYVYLVPKPNANGYQAVFLSNGQVYFGKLHGAHTKSPTLDEVFYLQVNQAQQVQGSNLNSTSTPTISGGNEPQFTLMKLGQSEIHGPEDRLFISKDQIVFWENLRPDSKVVKTIQDFSKQPVK